MMDLEALESKISMLEYNVVFILEVLASAEPVREATDDLGNHVPTQYVIEEHEKQKAKEMLQKHGIWI